MSRSNPNTSIPHPAVRWFQWNGAEDGGFFRYFDKEKGEKGENVNVPMPFTFILLDELATIKGWSEKQECFVGSNEVRDTRNEAFVVKTYKGGQASHFCTGHYAFIKDKVNALGGSFASNLYIAFKDGDELKVGSLMLRGAALSAWFEFRKQQRKNFVELDGKKVPAIYAKAITVKSFEEGKKGRVTFRSPVFSLLPIGEETNAKAIELDKQLQEYLEGYFKRSKADAEPAHPAEAPQAEAPEEIYEPSPAPEPEPEPETETEPETDNTDDIPF